MTPTRCGEVVRVSCDPASGDPAARRVPTGHGLDVATRMPIETSTGQWALDALDRAERKRVGRRPMKRREFVAFVGGAKQ
jgi:hypothetical protein